MKKKSIFLIIISSILGLGVIMILTGLAFGGKVYSFSIGRNTVESSKSVSHNLPAISLSDTKDIQNLDFDLNANKIEVKTGKEFSVQGGRLSENTVENGVWTMKSNFSDYFYKFQLFGLSLTFPKVRNNKKDYEKITITLPDDIKLQDITITAAAAELDIDLLHCETFDLDVSAGDVLIESLFTDTADISLSAGELDIDKYQILQSGDIDCKAGDLNLGEKKYGKENLCNNLDVTCSVGDADIYGKLTSNSYITCSLGDITLYLAGGQGNYSVDHSSSSLGDITFFNGEGQVSSGSNEVYGTLDVDCTLGDIDVYYLGN